MLRLQHFASLQHSMMKRMIICEYLEFPQLNACSKGYQINLTWQVTPCHTEDLRAENTYCMLRLALTPCTHFFEIGVVPPTNFWFQGFPNFNQKLSFSWAPNIDMRGSRLWYNSYIILTMKVLKLRNQKESTLLPEFWYISR